MTTNTKEIGFENFIEEHLLNNNAYIKRNSNQNYDKEFCLDKELVIEFIKQTQPEQWEWKK